jgi:site-specific recombinase XerD
MGIFTIGEGKENKPHVHLLRHSFAIHGAMTAENMTDLIKLRSMLQHTNLNTTLWYLDHFNLEEKKEFLERMFKP